MSAESQPRYTFDDYLAAERLAVEAKHEYVAGQIYAMTGASYHHNLITANLTSELHNQLKARPCTVLTSDMRVHIEVANAGKYPDIVVICDEPEFYDKRHDVIENPIFLVEVLSPSTEAYDRGGKFSIYRSLPSLEEYVLIAQDRHQVEVFSRQTDGRWLLSEFTGPEAVVSFESIKCQTPLQEIYHKVNFQP